MSHTPESAIKAKSNHIQPACQLSYYALLPDSPTELIEVKKLFKISCLVHRFVNTMTYLLTQDLVLSSNYVGLVNNYMPL
jgi:hypothetical protein